MLHARIPATAARVPPLPQLDKTQSHHEVSTLELGPLGWRTQCVSVTDGLVLEASLEAGVVAIRCRCGPAMQPCMPAVGYIFIFDDGNGEAWRLRAVWQILVGPPALAHTYLPSCVLGQSNRAVVPLVLSQAMSQGGLLYSSLPSALQLPDCSPTAGEIRIVAKPLTSGLTSWIIHLVHDPTLAHAAAAADAEANGTEPPKPLDATSSQRASSRSLQVRY